MYLSVIHEGLKDKNISRLQYPVDPESSLYLMSAEGARRCCHSRRGFEPHSAQWYFIFLPIHFFLSTCISNDPDLC